MVNDFNLKGKIAVITGGAGIICSEMARALASQGVITVLIGRTLQKLENVANDIEKNYDVTSLGISADVTDRLSLENAKRIVNEKFGPVDILINGAGGNSSKATTKIEQIDGSEKDLNETFFGLDLEGFQEVFDLNFKGTLLPTMVFATDMIRRKSGNIINVSSMNSYRPLTKIAAYSAAKAAINNFTQWLAVHFAKTGVRVNAIAPGFLLTDQNRFLLINESTGEPTPRSKKIIANTPMERFGTPEEMTGALLFLASDLSKFVTGVVIPVDGGFNAFSGV